MSNDKEGIKLIVRANPTKLVDDYPYERATSGVISTKTFTETRILPLIGDFYGRDFRRNFSSAAWSNKNGNTP
ncbi:MAG: hypothetical protein OXC62_14065 [Aestuariivita sp.]|nr:hypothetical protein [Aestuariivita sp.]